MEKSFLLEIAEKFQVKNPIITANNDYFILGLPFYNDDISKGNFDKAIDNWVNEI